MYVINLSHRTDRRATITAHLSQRGISKFSFVEAIDKNVDKPLIDFYWAQDNRSQALNSSPGARACFLSHMRALRQVLLNDDPGALIVEDDAALYRGFVARVDAAVAAHQEADIILFSSFVTGFEDMPPAGKNI